MLVVLRNRCLGGNCTVILVSFYGERCARNVEHPPLKRLERLYCLPMLISAFAGTEIEFDLGVNALQIYYSGLTANSHRPIRTDRDILQNSRHRKEDVT